MNLKWCTKHIWLIQKMIGTKVAEEQKSDEIPLCKKKKK